jgi:hypothetical protein
MRRGTDVTANGFCVLWHIAHCGFGIISCCEHEATCSISVEALQCVSSSSSTVNHDRRNCCTGRRLHGSLPAWVHFNEINEGADDSLHIGERFSATASG